MIQTLLLISMLVPNSRVSYGEMLWMARAVQGEVSVMGEERERTGTWVVHVALNRTGSRWFPDDLETVIRQGFAGAHVVQMPEAWAFRIVTNALLQRTAEDPEDPTNGALFIFGGIDINECMDWSSHRGSAYREGWVFSVHMFARWPYVEGCVP